MDEVFDIFSAPVSSICEIVASFLLFPPFFLCLHACRGEVSYYLSCKSRSPVGFIIWGWGVNIWVGGHIVSLTMGSSRSPPSTKPHFPKSHPPKTLHPSHPLIVKNRKKKATKNRVKPLKKAPLLCMMTTPSRRREWCQLTE